MTTTKTFDRAAYMRDYRARKAAEAEPVDPPPCAYCHTPLDTQRGGARFCSDSCRSAHWRAITHRTHTHNPAGFIIPANQSGAGGLQWCTHQTSDTTFCKRTATWWITTYRNGDPVFFAIWRCDEHTDNLLGSCDPDAFCHGQGTRYGGGTCPLAGTRPDSAPAD